MRACFYKRLQHKLQKYVYYVRHVSPSVCPTPWIFMIYDAECFPRRFINFYTGKHNLFFSVFITYCMKIIEKYCMNT
jgi:hypothetical protein